MAINFAPVSPLVIRTTVSLLLLSATAALGQSPENVAVVINEASPASQRVADHYIQVRGIPAANVIRIHTSTEETIDRGAYGSSIEQPIATALAREGLQDRILYIVLTKGIPLRIEGTQGADGTVSSVDSELTMLYRRMAGVTVPVRGRTANPYYLDTAPTRQAQRFTHRTYDIFLVSRLDAFTADDAIALIDRAQKPSREGRIVLDQRAGLLTDPTGDKWLADAARGLTEAGQGDRVMIDNTTNGVRDVDNVLGYYSWGSNDPANHVRRYGLRFVPGALAATFVSSDARTFQIPPDSWVPGSDWNDKKTWFGGSPQSLSGDLIREGATGVAGHVAEPYLQSAVRPDILFSVYLAGFNLIESFYLALPHLSWQAVVVGDPLCAPFREKALTRADIEEAVDPATELPALFSKRRLAVVQPTTKGAPAKAAVLIVLAESRSAKGDLAGAKTALEEVTALAPSLINPQLQLGILYEQAGQFAEAMQRYRAILKVQPNNAVALNNLAYALAVHAKQTAEALPLARKSLTLSPGNPTVLDTAGWIEHLAGNDQEAARLLGQALRLGTTNADIYLHAAIVFGGVGAIKEAQTALTAALRLNPELAKHEEVAQLQKRLTSK